MEKDKNEREVAVNTLLQIEQGKYSHLAINKMLKSVPFGDRQKEAFTVRLIEGTLERQIELDYVIDQYSKLRVTKMKPVIRVILRSAVYQILYMDRVPDHAACNEAVRITEKKKLYRLKSFVNGVLRSIVRGKDKRTYPEPVGSDAYLSVRYSLPLWLVRQWRAAYGEETLVRMAESFLQEKPLTVRVNQSRIQTDELEAVFRLRGMDVKRSEQLPYVLYLRNYDHLFSSDEFEKGLFYVQDISSMWVAQWADPKAGDRVLDLCGAPGGKALHIAEKLEGSGHVETRDVSDQKVALIRENIQRSGLHNIEAVCHDATVLDETCVEKEDIVIADLPCSGLGVIGRKPDIKNRMTPEQEQELVKLQRAILKQAACYVKPGGKLIYSTCTVHRAENQENVVWFLENYKDYSLTRDRQMFPGIDEGDGFYIAEMRRGQVR